MNFSIPTYYGGVEDEKQCSGKEIYDTPQVPVAIARSEYGLMSVVLGTMDVHSVDKPNIAIERRPHGWDIAIYPKGGDHYGCALFIHDDGRLYFCPGSPKHPVVVVGNIPKEIDHAADE